ncbi:hypothetical protein MBANPS3_004920 [Mucor bainieri]
MSRPEEEEEVKRPVKRRRVEPEHAIQRFNLQHLASYFTPDTPIIVGSYVKVILHSVGIGVILYVLYHTLTSFTNEIQARYLYEMKGNDHNVTGSDMHNWQKRHIFAIKTTSITTVDLT